MHAIIFSTDEVADREFLRDVLGLPYVDSGGGWLIFQLPPSEVGIHPTDGAPHHEVFLMTDDIAATTAELRGKGVEIVADSVTKGYGVETVVRLPGGGQLAVYEPRHALARGL